MSTYFKISATCKLRVAVLALFTTKYVLGGLLNYSSHSIPLRKVAYIR